MAPISSNELPGFQPGAHIATFLETSSGTLQRHYSLCNQTVSRDAYKIAVKRTHDSRGGSRYWHDEVYTGKTLLVSPPVNHFRISPAARHHLFIAGGIGITPFIPMLAQLRSHGGSFELHYAVSSPDKGAFVSWLKTVVPRETHIYYSSQRRLTTEVLMNRRIGTHVYLCGPPGMTKEFQSGARSLGYSHSNIHLEAFAAFDDKTNQPFLVHLYRSEAKVQVPSDKTLLQSLLDAGIKVPSSCHAGGCGTCQIEVLEGEIDHRDFYLTEEEQKQQNIIVPCVSRARGQDLKLDL